MSKIRKIDTVIITDNLGKVDFGDILRYCCSNEQSCDCCTSNMRGRQMDLAKGGEHLCVALDLPTYPDNLNLVFRYAQYSQWFKIGDNQIHGGEGSELLVKILKARERRIFYDAKLYQPEGTLVNTISLLRRRGIDAVSVSGDVGLVALRAAVNMSGSLQVWVVTVPTSMNRDDVHDTYGRSVEEVMSKRMYDVLESGADGFICSGMDLPSLLEQFPEVKLKMKVTPGIVPDWYRVYPHQHKRHSTPKDAFLSGSDLLVVGSPLITHFQTDSKGRVERILSEINSV